MTITDRPDVEQSVDAAPSDDTPWGLASPMRVRKRNGDLEPVDVNKIVRAVGHGGQGGSTASTRCAWPPARSAACTTAPPPMELDELSIRTAAALVSEEPNYCRLAGRLLATFIEKEVANQDIHSFSQSIARRPSRPGSSATTTAELVANHSASSTRPSTTANDKLLRVLRPAHGLRPLPAAPPRRAGWSSRRRSTSSCASPAACRTSADEAIEFYRLISSLDYLPATPTLFNSRHHAPADVVVLPARLARRTTLDVDLRPLQGRRPAVEVRRRHRPRVPPRAQPGLADPRHQRPVQRHRAVAQDARLARSSAVNQGGKRKGAACVYLETWHADIEEFLELRDNTGDEARRTHNLNLANWVPDLFMERVEKDWTWSLFDPQEGPAPHRPVRRRVRAGLPRGRVQQALRAPGAGPPALRRDDAHARPDRQRLDDVQGPVQPALQPDRRLDADARGRAPVQPVHRDPRGHEPGRDRGVQPRLDQPRPLRRHRPRHRRHVVRLRAPRRGRARPRCATSTGSSTSTSTRPTRRRARTPRGARSGSAHGPAGRVLQDAPAVRLPRGPRHLAARSPRRSTSTPCGRRPSSPSEIGPHPAYADDPRSPAASCSSTCAGRRRPPTRALGAAARPHRRARPAQLAAHRHRPDGHDRLDRRLPTSASSRRCPTCSSARRCRASSSRSTPTSCATCRRRGLWDDEIRRRRSSGPRVRSRTSTAIPDDQGALPHGVGDPDAVARSTWPPSAARSSTRASRSTCSWSRRRSGSCRRCTCTPGSRASRPPTTCAPARRPASPRPPRTSSGRPTPIAPVQPIKPNPPKRRTSDDEAASPARSRTPRACEACQ